MRSYNFHGNPARNNIIDSYGPFCHILIPCQQDLKTVHHFTEVFIDKVQLQQINGDRAYRDNYCTKERKIMEETSCFLACLANDYQQGSNNNIANICAINKIKYLH